MQRKPSVGTDTLLFIPDDILETYREEASQQVAMSWALRPVDVIERHVAVAHSSGPAAVSPRPTYQDRLLVVAAYMALIGWTVCTGWWTWLAVDTGDTVWTAFAGGGGVTLLIGLIAAARLRPTRLPAPAPRR